MMSDPRVLHVWALAISMSILFFMASSVDSIDTRYDTYYGFGTTYRDPNSNLYDFRVKSSKFTKTFIHSKLVENGSFESFIQKGLVD